MPGRSSDARTTPRLRASRATARASCGRATRHSSGSARASRPPTPLAFCASAARATCAAGQLEVLELLADGLRNGQIADRLVLSPKTVDHHVSAILRKLEVDTRTEAAAEAGRMGIVER